MQSSRSMLSRITGNFISSLVPAGSLLVVVFSLLSIQCAQESIDQSQLDMNRSTSSNAPVNLRRAAESFRYSLAAETSAIDSGQLVKTQAYRKLEETLSGYATRLELHKSQSDRLHWIMCLSSLAGTIIMLIGSFLGRRFTPALDNHLPSKNFNDTHGQ